MPSIPTEALLDVNLIIASMFADHVRHNAARNFVENLERYHTTPTTQGGFLRFATRPWKNERKEEQTPRLKMAEALAKLREFTNTGGHRFLADVVALPNWDCGPCKVIVNGQTPICFIWLAQEAWYSPRWKVGWPILMTRRGRLFL
jgi:hypothetical protein